MTPLRSLPRPPLELCLLCWLICAGPLSCYGRYQPPPAPPVSESIGPDADATAQGWPTTAPATQPVATQPASTQPVDDGEPLALTVRQAILVVLENNRSLAVQRLQPSITRTFEDQRRAAFDPVVSADLARQRVVSGAPGGARGGGSGVETTTGGLAIEQFLPTGTSLRASLDSEDIDPSLFSDASVATRAGLSVTQALLQGAGVAVNLASLRQARLDTRISQYELRGFAEALTANAENTYWDYTLAQRRIQIFTDSLRLAEKQQAETQERIRIGRLAETELAAAQAEVALRKENLINANSDLAKTRLILLRLLNAPGGELWERQLVLRNQPAVPDVKLDDVARHVQVALRLRPDLNQARLLIQRDELDIVQTRNGLLPRLDLFITLGKTGYASSFGRSLDNLRGDGYEVLVGLSAEQPVGNRDARAQHRRAVYSHRQSIEAIDNLAQLVQVDVRSAYVEVNRAREQIAATAVTRQHQAESLRAEQEKFRVGKSTSLLVAQAQRDLLASQISEIEAIVNYLKALVNLYLLEGSLLQRRGIAAPGAEPVVIAPQPAGRGSR